MKTKRTANPSDINSAALKTGNEKLRGSLFINIYSSMILYLVINRSNPLFNRFIMILKHGSCPKYEKPGGPSL
jgi:hypothetical protein